MIRLFTNSAMAKMPVHSTLGNVRYLSQTNRMFEKTPAKSTSVESRPSQSSATQAATDTAPPQACQKQIKHRNVNYFDKRVLVSVGKYKSVDDVPDKVAHETLDRARDKFRVKMCIYMMVVCTIICIVQVVRGKQAVERGESVVNSNLEWHKKYNEASAKTEIK